MSQMIEVKTAGLSGDLLDCLVATIENPAEKIFHNCDGYTLRWHNKPPKFSAEWAQGGPLIAKYAIEFEYVTDAMVQAFTLIDSGIGYGVNHLIATCRAIVAAKLGDTVAVPAELLP